MRHAKSSLSMIETNKLSVSVNLPAPERSTNSDSSHCGGPELSTSCKIVDDMYKEQLEKFRARCADKDKDVSQSSLPKLGKRSHSRMRMTEAVPFNFETSKRARYNEML